MLLQYFKNKENKHQDITHLFYIETIDVVKKIAVNLNNNTKKDFNFTFEIMSIILFVIFYSSKIKKKLSYDVSLDINNQDLFNLFIKDIDHSLRIAGIGDMSIGKNVKLYVKKFYFRLSELENILSNENTNIKLFDEYLARYNLYIDKNSRITSNNILIDLKKLIDRCKNQKISLLIYKNLFK